MKSDYTVNLNDLESTGIIVCPYWGKGKAYVYGATGMQSSGCSNALKGCLLGLFKFGN